MFTDPRWLTIQHFIKDDTNTPNIIFSIISSFLETLWTHIKRSSNQFTSNLLILILNGMNKPKVSYFVLIIMNENIGRLNISMYESTCQYLSITLTNVLNYSNSFGWLHFCIQLLLQISIITELTYNVSIFLIR